MSYLGQLLALSAVVMGIAQTVTRERLFESLRNRLGGQDSWLGYLVSCPTAPRTGWRSSSCP